VPVALGAVVAIAGALQFTTWKARHLARCRQTAGCGCALPADAAFAFRNGMRLGFHCVHCCAGLNAILLVLGVMDLRTMGVVTVAITLERLAPRGELIARVIGAVIVTVGMVLIVRAVEQG
jgi:predicted metal-binding membrane protein